MLAAGLLLVGCRQLAGYRSAPPADAGRADRARGDLRSDARDGAVDPRRDGPHDLWPEGLVGDGLDTDSMRPDLGSPATMGLCWLGWCYEHPRPQGLDLYAVDCFSKDACLAVGQRGIVLYYDGSAWQTIEHTASTAALLAVQMTGKTSALLAGSDGALLNMQGLKIASELAPTAQTINAVWVDASGTYLATQDGFYARPSSSSGWTKLSVLGSEAGVALWATGSTLFVGSTAGLYRRQGSGALKKVCSSNGSIYGLSGASAQDVFFVTYPGQVLRFDGTTCATAPAYTLPKAGVGDIVRLSGGDVYVVNDGAAAYQATQGWQALPGLGGRGIADDRKGGAWVVGRRGLVRHVVGATIDPLDVAATQQRLRRGIETKDGPLAIGEQGTILVRATSGSWQVGPFPVFPKTSALDGWARSQQQVYIAAANGGLWRGEVGSFTQVSTLQTFSVWGEGTALYLGHPGGKLSHIDGNGVAVSLSSTLTGNVNGLAGLTSSSLYLAAGTQLGLFDGTKASVLWSDAGANLQRVSAVFQGAVAVGKGGFIVLCEAAVPNCSVLAQRSEELVGVAAGSLDDFFVVTADGTTLHYVQRSLQETLLVPLTSAADVTIDKQGTVRVYGGDGSVVVRVP